MIENLLKDLLAIASPTYKEAEKTAFVADFFKDAFPSADCTVFDDNLLLRFDWQDGLPHLAFVGHSDVVPKHFEPYIDSGRLHGAGASDMQAGVACMMQFLVDHYDQLSRQYNLSFVLYAREEGTALKDNGLYAMIAQFPDYFRSIDTAIVAEPTNGEIQLGCVGSIHARVTFNGVSAHSARPWDGDNALYKAAPFISAMAAVEPMAHDVFGVQFYDVYQITESACERGRTTVPSFWQCNVNYRFAPVFSLDEAKDNLQQQLVACHVGDAAVEIVDAVPAGKVCENDLFKSVVATLGCPITAKQAWTDVAQLSMLGIPAFNFGPGLTAQAHKENEYVLIDDLYRYNDCLKKLVKGDET